MSRNLPSMISAFPAAVTPRERRVSRNQKDIVEKNEAQVTPRERRVSRNHFQSDPLRRTVGHASREACE